MRYETRIINKHYEQGVQDAITVLCKNSAGVFLGEFYENEIESKYGDTDVAEIMSKLAMNIQRVIPEYVLGTGYTNMVLNSKLLSDKEKEKLKLFDRKLKIKMEEERLQGDKSNVIEQEEYHKNICQKNIDLEKRRLAEEEFDAAKKKYYSIFGGEVFAFYYD